MIFIQTAGYQWVISYQNEAHKYVFVILNPQIQVLKCKYQWFEYETINLNTRLQNTDYSNIRII